MGYNYDNVKCIWEMKDKDSNVVRKISRNNMCNPFDFYNATDQVKAHAELVRRDGIGFGMVADAFMVDNGKRGMEEHYVTTSGVIVVRKSDTKKATSIMVAKPKQIERYYTAVKCPAPSRIMDVARKNHQKW